MTPTRKGLNIPVFFNNLEIHVVVKYFYKSASIEMEKENYDVLWSIDVLVFCLLQNGLV